MSHQNRSLKQALMARWSILPDHIKRVYWHKLKFQDKWVLTYQNVNFDSWRYIKFGDWDIEYHPGAPVVTEDPVLALQSVFEERQEHPEILEVLFYPSAKKGPSLPSHIEILCWNGHFRYADHPELTSILDPHMNRVEYYHPWGFWARLDCYADINIEVMGLPLLVLRFSDHPRYSGRSHKELTIGLRQLSYKLFHARIQVLYRVLSNYVPCDTENVFAKWGWGLETLPSEDDYQQAEHDSYCIARASCGDDNDIISRELGGKWFMKNGYGVTTDGESPTSTNEESSTSSADEEPQPVRKTRWARVAEQIWERQCQQRRERQREQRALEGQREQQRRMQSSE